MSECAQCGAETTGAFCASCGTPTGSGAAVGEAAPGAVRPPATAPIAPVAPSLTPPPPPPMPQAPPWTDPTPPGPPAPYATWIRRVGGSLIDGVIFGVPFLILLIAGLVWGFSTLHLVCVQNANGTGQTCTSAPGGHFAGGGVLLLIAALLWWIAWVLYVIFSIGGPHGATVGMRAVKVRCVRDLTFAEVGKGLSLGRFAITWVFGLFWPVSLVDHLFPLWDAKHQTLHDKVVSTVVLYEGAAS